MPAVAIQAPIVHKVENAIHRINLYPVNSATSLASLTLICWTVIYPVDCTF